MKNCGINRRQEKRIEADTRSVEDKLFGMILAASPASREAVQNRLDAFNKDMVNPIRFQAYPLSDEIEGMWP